LSYSRKSRAYYTIIPFDIIRVMFLRLQRTLMMTGLVFLSGCAFFCSDDETETQPEGFVAGEEISETNDLIVLAAASTPPASSKTSVSPLKIVDRPSPNFDRRTLPVSLIVLHYTAAPLKESLNALRNPRGPARVSCHYLVSEHGTIYRLVDESNRAWHAGVSRWKGITDVNSASIGIEMVNLGHDRFGYPRPFAVEQIEAVIRLCLDIQSRYDITDVVGHSDVAPTRKIDPGELFPWRLLYDRGVKVSTKGFVR